MWSRIKATLLRQFIHDVPHELAACEFGCKLGKCSHDKWERCERRIRSARRLEEYDQSSSVKTRIISEMSQRHDELETELSVEFGLAIAFGAAWLAAWLHRVTPPAHH